MVRRRAQAVAIAWATLPLLVALLAWLPLCAVLHRCGCEPAWLSGMEHCNVHHASGPRCPWCVHPTLSQACFALALGAAWVVQWRRARHGEGHARAASWALAAWIAVAFASAALVWLASDYPHFVVLDARRLLHLPSGPLPR